MTVGCRWGRRDETCRASDPIGFRCTLPDGHDGRHEAHGPLPADELIRVWGNP